MSHFSVLVVGNDVEKQMAPYHEFECTGDDNEFVQDVDKTEEARKEYASHTETRYKDAEGGLHDPYGPEFKNFYREFTPEEVEKHDTRMLGSGSGGGISWTSNDWGDGKGYRAKVHFLPEGWAEVEVKTPDVEPFATFVEGYYGHKPLVFGEAPDLAGEHKYGYIQLDENHEVVKVIDRTNPEKKWDWFEIGGRWNGFFRLKGLAVGVLGKPGLQAMNEDYEPRFGNRADVAFKEDIDIEGMRDEAGEEAGTNYDLYLRETDGFPTHVSWEQIKENNRTGKLDEDGEPEVNYGAARDEYGVQPAVKALRKNKETMWFEPDNFLCTRDEYIERARKSAISTFAVVKDGKWHERGEMGWWGAVSNEKGRDDWNSQFASLIDDLPGNTLLTVVDCHI